MGETHRFTCGVINAVTEVWSVGGENSEEKGTNCLRFQVRIPRVCNSSWVLKKEQFSR